MKPTGHKPKVPLKQLLQETLIHQDIESYIEGLLKKVDTVIGTAMDVIDEAYDQFSDLPFNEPAVLQLKGNFERYDFEYFI